MNPMGSMPVRHTDYLILWNLTWSLTISVGAWDRRYQGGGQGDYHGGEKGGRKAKVTILNYANNNDKLG